MIRLQRKVDRDRRQYELAKTSASTSKDGTLTTYKNNNPRGSPPLAAYCDTSL